MAKFEDLWGLKKNQFEAICKDSAVVSVLKSFARMCFWQGYDKGFSEALEVAKTSGCNHTTLQDMIDHRMTRNKEILGEMR